MSPVPSRRRFLRLVGTAVAGGLAGCSRGGSPDGPTTVTPAPVPSDRPTPTEGARGTAPTPTADDVGFDATVRSGFTDASPARLEIAFWNASGRRLTALDGPHYFLPFVDDDYAAPDGTGEPAVLLVPDDAELTVDPDGQPAGSVGEFLPDGPTDGCWTLPFDWPAARGASTLTLRAISLAPGARRRHGYGLYFVDECSPGTYRFENTFDLSVGDPPAERDLARVRLAFDLRVSASMAVSVRVDEPRVGPLEAES